MHSIEEAKITFGPFFKNVLEKPPLKSLSPDSCDPKWSQVKSAAEVNDNEHHDRGEEGKEGKQGRIAIGHIHCIKKSICRILKPSWIIWFL